MNIAEKPRDTIGSEIEKEKRDRSRERERERETVREAGRDDVLAS